MRAKVTDDVVTTAIAVLLGKRKSKENLPSGFFQFQGGVRLGLAVEVSKAGEETYRPTVALPLKAILGICLARAGLREEKIVKAIRDAAKVALAGGDQIAEHLRVTAAALEAAEAALDKLPEETRQGKTFVTGTVEILEVVKG